MCMSGTTTTTTAATATATATATANTNTNHRVGRIPCELLQWDVGLTCASEWASRMICWALQPLTHIAAPEHLVCGTPSYCGDIDVATVMQRRILVYNRSNPQTPVFAIEVGGEDMGCVVCLTGSGNVKIIE